MGFDVLGLSEETLAAVTASGYSDPTPIQAQAIPQVFAGRDVLGIAQTGTGKTASFTLPMIDILAAGRPRARMPRSLILEPTRELAAQVSEAFDKYGQNTKLSKALLIGGVNFGDQEKALDRGVDVLIATPGRLLDHYERGKLLLNGIEILVIDEADRMLDMGFIPDVERICGLIPKVPQTLFFSATMPPPIEKLTKKFLRDPKLIEVSAPSSTAKTIEQFLVPCAPRGKRAALRTLLRREEINSAIIFCNRKRDVSEVYKSLDRHGFNVGQLHGDMAQSERLEVLSGFKDGNIELLVASDVAARGLDIKDVSHVFNFDIPSHAEDYVHRIGRTGRAGRAGKAFMLATNGKDDQRYLAAIEKMTEQKITPDPDFDGSDASAQDDRPTRSHRPERPERGDRPSRGGRSGTGRGRPDRSGSRASTKSPEDVRDAPDDWPKEPVIGLGPHVPAFLTRDVPARKK